MPPRARSRAVQGFLVVEARVREEAEAKRLGANAVVGKPHFWQARGRPPGSGGYW